MEWQAALDRYPAVIAQQGVQRLAELDAWYHTELPGLIRSRQPGYVNHAELVHITEWKMARGVWRARNLVLVRGNVPEQVEATSKAALAKVPDPVAPIKLLAELAGVGPATASAVVAGVAPEIYPFFDELVAAQIPSAEKLVFNMRYYAWYSNALRERAEQLGKGWTPANVERALWSNAGGKTGWQR